MKRIVTVALLAVLGCVALQGCGGAQDRKARAMERGHQYVDEQNYAKARVEFSNALQLDPNDAEARYLAAMTAEKLGDLRAAVQGYQGTLNVNPTHPLALAAIGRLYVFSGLPQQGLEMVEKGLAANPDHPELLVVRAAAELALGRDDQAFVDGSAALAKSPDLEYSVALLAGIYRKRGQIDEAVRLIEDTLTRTPNSVDLRVVLAQLSLDSHANARAEQELKRIVELRPKELAHRERLVTFYASTGKTEQAEATLRELITLEPKSTERKLALVTYIAGQKSFDAAEAELQKLVKQSPTDETLRLASGQFYEANNLAEQAEKIYAQVIDRAGVDPAGLSARNRLATLRLRANRVSEAEPLIDQVLSKNPRDNDALVLRATLALARNKALDAITDLRAVLRDQPDAPGVLRTLARAHVENHEPDLARENYRRAVEVDPGNRETRLEFADFLTRRGEFAEAKQLVEALLTVSPQDLPALQAQFRVLSASKDETGAAQTAANIVKFYPENPVGYYLQGLLHEGTGDSAGALKGYEAALAKAPRAAEPLGALARVLVTTNRRPEARARLERTVKEYPDHAVALNLLAEILLSDRDFAGSAAMADRAIAVNKAWWLPYRTKALAAIAQGSADQAKQIYRDALVAAGNVPAIGMDLAALYERDHQVDQAIDVYKQLHASNPDLEPLANNLAMLLATYRDDAASHDEAGQLVRGFRASDNPAYLNTYGWVRYRQGQYDEAVTYLRRAATASPASPIMHYHLGMALLASGQKEQARAELEKAVASEQTFPGRDAATAALQSLPGKG